MLNKAETHHDVHARAVLIDDHVPRDRRARAQHEQQVSRLGFLRLRRDLDRHLATRLCRHVVQFVNDVDVFPENINSI